MFWAHESKSNSKWLYMKVAERYIRAWPLIIESKTPVSTTGPKGLLNPLIYCFLFFISCANLQISLSSSFQFSLPLLVIGYSRFLTHLFDAILRFRREIISASERPRLLAVKADAFIRNLYKELETVRAKADAFMRLATIRFSLPKVRTHPSHLSSKLAWGRPFFKACICKFVSLSLFWHASFFCCPAVCLVGLFPAEN